MNASPEKSGAGSGISFEATIGLEVHAQLLTRSKLFCGCSTEFGAPSNTNVCPVCLGHPGVLPVLNRRAVEFAVMAAMGIGCRVQAESRFARKNYFYPDLPKGYQISQYREPLAVDGALTIETPEGVEKSIRVERLHMEEDAGKSIHLAQEGTGSGTALDFNRAGVPLVEIVSRPDLASPEEAHAYLEALRSVLLYLGVCACNMEEGNLRCDANVSVAPAGSGRLGIKTEVKNLNSMRFVRQAIAYEIERQKKTLSEGGTVRQETLLWDPDARCTRLMRSKEEAHDYRYFPEPDLPPLILDATWVETIRSSMPELPLEKRRRWMRNFALPVYDAQVLTQEPALAKFFEDCTALCGDAKAASNWLMTEALAQVKETGTPIERSVLTPALLAELIGLIRDGSISGKIAKEIFPEMFRSGESPKALIQKKGLAQISDETALKAVVEEVLREHAAIVEEIRGGKEKSFGFLMGQAMKKTRGQGNPQLLQKLLREALGKG
jgi:aspartyl-tRNA(Asn)/glutamyl-tRNA(Gln) amidotransferase subunit B